MCIKSIVPTGLALVYDQLGRVTKTHEPVAPSDFTSRERRASAFTKCEHEQFTFADHHEELFPVVLLGSFSCGLPIQLVLQHPFLCPRSSKK